MLDEKKVAYRFRDYKKEPLSKTEIRALLKKLGVGPREVLRKKDRAFKELGLTGEETDARLVALMAEHPGLLQRPIAVAGKKAIVGRPAETLLDLA